MKKGVVMEQHRRYMIMMTPDGHFEKAKKVPGSDVGQEIPFDPYPEKEWKALPFSLKSFQLNYKFLAMVTAILLAIVPVYNWYDTNSAYAYVNIDINPSIEMKVNDRMQVIDIVPLNDDARVIIDKLKDWRKESVQNVTILIIKTSQEQGFLNKDKQVMIGVSYKEQPQKDHLVTEVIDKSLKEQPLAEVQVATFEVPKEVHERAEKEKVSMNTLMAEDVKKEETEKAEESKQKVTKKEHVKDTDKIKQLDENEKTIFESFYKKQKEVKDKIIPGLEKKDDLPPGLEKKQTGEKDKALPPGQQKKKNDQDNRDKGKGHSDNAKGKEKQDLKVNDNQVKETVKEVTEHVSHLPPGLLKKTKDNLDNHKYWYYKEGNDTGKDQYNDVDKEDANQKGNKDHDKTPPGQEKKQKRDNEKDDNHKSDDERKSDDNHKSDNERKSDDD